MPPNEALLTFEYDRKRRASIVAASIRGEVGEIAGDRTRAALDRDGSTVEIRVEADDLVALRAGINTWCSFVDVASAVAAIGAPVTDPPD